MKGEQSIIAHELAYGSAQFPVPRDERYVAGVLCAEAVDADAEADDASVDEPGLLAAEESSISILSGSRPGSEGSGSSHSDSHSSRRCKSGSSV